MQTHSDTGVSHVSITAAPNIPTMVVESEKNSQIKSQNGATFGAVNIGHLWLNIVPSPEQTT